MENTISSTLRQVFEKNTDNKLSMLSMSEWIGLIAVYVFLFFAWDSKHKAMISFDVLMVACTCNKDFWRDILRSKVIRIVGLLLFYLLWRTLFAILRQPEYAQFHLQDGFHLVCLAGFIFVGWILRKNQLRVFLALTVAMLGFLLARLNNFPWHLLGSGSQWWGIRMDLGLPSAIAFGQYVAAAALGLLIMAPRILAGPQTVTGRMLTLFVWILFFILFVQGLVISQARGVWLSVAVIVLVLSTTLFFLRERFVWKRYRIVLAVTMVFFLSIGYLNHETILLRLTTEGDTVSNLLSGKVEAIHSYDEKGNVKSMGIRLNMILFGIEHWKENPVFGLGPGITRPLIRDQWPFSAIHLYDDLHNDYIEILLRLGLVGSALMLLILVKLFRQGWCAYREGRVGGDLLLFLYVAIALDLLVNASNFRMLNYDWRYYWFLFGGALLSLDPAFVMGRSLAPKPSQDSE